MIGRVIEVADDNRHIATYRGFLTITDTAADNTELGRIPIDDIAAVIANAHGLSYTNNALVKLAQQGSPFVLCGANHNPVGMLWSVDGNFHQAKRMDAQLAAKLPMKKRVWAEIIRAKLQQQARTLDNVGKPSAPLAALSKQVRSGDVGNIEAQGARKYWTLLFGQDFRRDKNSDGINALLNYGYMVLRAATARTVIAAGLHPTLGIHHSNEGNPMRLVDDLMEPFRPLMDLKVFRITQSTADLELTPETKRNIVSGIYQDLCTDEGASPLSNCIQRLSTSLAHIYLGERKSLELPRPSPALELPAF